MRLNPTSWIVWVASASTIALVTRNPWYLAILGVLALAVRWKLTGQRLGRTTMGLFGGLLLFPALLNVVLSRVGETVLLRLPIAVLGGPYTLEALLFGLSAGVQIASLLGVMMAFGAALGAPDLLRRTPPGFYPIGVSASIGLSFAPQARKAFAAVREAQQVRGHEPRGWRDLPSLVTPLVVLSLESALGLAEGMVARGWGRGGMRGWRRWLVPTAWISLAAGLVLWALLPEKVGWVLACLTAGGLALWVSLRGQDGKNRYRPEAWSRVDTVIVGVALGVAVAFLFLSLNAPGWLGYYPYPKAAWPSFRLALALGVGLLSGPLWIRRLHD